VLNVRTLAACRATGARCIDLAGLMAEDGREAYYYDDVHFTEAGSKRVAEILTEELRPLVAQLSR